MSLPDRSIPWPPAEDNRARSLYETWGAWHSGDPAQLERVYRSRAPVGPRPQVRASQLAGGVVGAAARWFWGDPPAEGETPVRLHAPLAADLSSTSADLLFGRQPLFRCENKQAQDRLDTILDGGAYNALLEAAELCSAYGGVYLRATWDTSVAQVPIWDAVAPDTAIPEFSHKRLKAVTFWRVVAEDKDTVWRHLERHEPGRVLHGLYRGTSTMLGRPMPLADHPQTEAFADHVDDQGAILTGADTLAARYVPNIRPHRLIRGSALGRSDYAGVEPLMDAYDATWSSWMEDLDIGRGRIMVAEDYLDDLGPGKGARFNPRRRVYDQLNIPHGPGDRPVIEAHQFAIRVEEHSRTARELLGAVLRSAGYSLGSFGLRDESEASGAQTATEVTSKRERSTSTTGRKREYWRPELSALAEVLLAIDAHHLDNPTPVERPSVEWPPDTGDPRALAETAGMLAQAENASVKTRVRMLHPDWDTEAVDTEVGRILTETGRAVPDPAGDWGSGAPRPVGAL